MKKKVISFTLVMSMVLSTACSGCGSTKKETDVSTKDSVTESAVADSSEKSSESVEKKVVTFETWNPADGGPDSPIHKIIDDFEKENPDIEINYVYVDSGSYSQQLKVELMGGEGPDVFGMNAGAKLVEYRDFEEDITSYCTDTYGDNWESQFIESCVSAIKDENACYGLPLGLTYAGLAWADVNMLKQYGINEVPTSYSALLDASKILRDNGQFPMAIGAKDSWLNGDTFMSIASDVDAAKWYGAINGTSSFNDPSIIQAFQIWQNCFNNGIFQDGAIGMTLYNDVNDMFQKEGSIPMILNGSWALNMYTLSDTETQKTFNSEGADHDLFLIDWNDDGKVCPMTAAVDVILCMNKYSNVKEEAFRFMDYLVHQGQDLLVNGYLEYMPTIADMKLSVSGISADGQQNLDFVSENAKNNVAGARMIDDADIYSTLLDVLDAVAINGMTPEEAAKKLDEVSQSITR